MKNDIGVVYLKSLEKVEYNLKDIAWHTNGNSTPNINKFLGCMRSLYGDEIFKIEIVLNFD